MEIETAIQNLKEGHQKRVCQEIYEFAKMKQWKLLELPLNKSTPIKYICKCKLEKSQRYKDAKRRNCRTCREEEFLKIPEDYTDDDGEIWKGIKGGWISNKGNAKNSMGKKLTLCPTKYRYYIGGRAEYASRLVACAFKIEHYERILDHGQFYVVSHLDDNPSNNCVENLMIKSKSSIGKENGVKSKKTKQFVECVKFNYEKDILPPSKEINLYGQKYTVYEDGRIANKQRFLTGSKSNGDKQYRSINFPSKTIKWHRIVCFAFHPIEGKKTIGDYRDLQVNHKNGNIEDNSSQNLEWVTSSENMKHAYKTKLNKKIRGVIQCNVNGEELRKFNSVAEAARETEDSEYYIRQSCKGKHKGKYIWKDVNKDIAEKNSKKYTSTFTFTKNHNQFLVDRVKENILKCCTTKSEFKPINWRQENIENFTFNSSELYRQVRFCIFPYIKCETDESKNRLKQAVIEILKPCLDSKYKLSEEDIFCSSSSTYEMFETILQKIGGEIAA